jgi:MYXO-CTERM domain-containing protein
MKWMGWNLRSRASFVFMAMLMAACSNDGCSCDGFESSPFPEVHYDKTFPRGAQVRLSPHGLRFFEGEVPNLLGSQLPDGLSFCVSPVDQSGIELCHTSTTCDDGTTGCQLEFTIDETRLVPTAPSTLNVQIVIGDVFERLPLDFLLSRCWLHLYKRGNQNAAAQITASVPIQFLIDQQSPTRDLQIKVDDIDVNLDDLDYRLSNRSSISGCSLVSASVKLLADGLLRDLIVDSLKDEIVPAVQELLCQSCDPNQPQCPNNASCRRVDGNNMCVYDATNECVPIKLGVEGKLLTNSLLGEYAQFEPANLDLMLLAADNAHANTGLSLAFRGGFQPESFDRCAPIDPTTRPPFEGIAMSPTIHGDVRPHNNEPFMFAFGIHKRFFDHALWSAWAGGALCLKVGTDTVDLLHTGTIGALLPSVRALADGNSGLYLLIAPQKAPTMVIGQNRITRQGNNNVVEEGLLTLHWDDMDLHFYGFVMERYVRLFTLRSDVRLPIALVPDADGNLLPVIGDLNTALTNMRPLNYEILADDPQRLIDLLPTLIGLAVPSLLESLSDPIELPDLEGYRLVIGPQDIRGIDNNEFMAIFADLERAPAEAYRAALTSVVTGHRVELGHRTESGIERPRVILDVMGVDTSVGPVSTAEMEYSYRVNGGSWSLFNPGPRLTIDHPLFSLQGRHTIDVRARLTDDVNSAQRVPTSIDVLVDFEAPTVSFERLGTTVHLEGYDVVDGAGELRYRHRILDGDRVLVDWTPWVITTTVELAHLDLPAHFTFEAEVKDRTGHVGLASRTMTLETRPDTITHSAPSTGGCGCASTSGSGPGEGLVWLLGLLGLLGLRRRRRSARAAKLGLLGLVALFLGTGCGGCKDDPATQQQCEQACPTNFICDDGECVRATCSNDDDCPDGICLNGECTSGCREASECGEGCGDGQFSVCQNNQCSCDVYCKDGCGDEQFCCYNSNSCQSYPNWCQGVTCETGFEPAIINRGQASSASCKVEGGLCECVSLPPIPMGWYGLYGSLAVNGSVKAFSTHNRTYRDLMVGILDSNNQPTWHWVDGVPADGEVRGDLQGPRGGISTRGPRVGTHTALVIDDSSTLHVFYHDLDAKALKYARGNTAGQFSMKVLDAQDEAGIWTSAVHHDGQIHVVYAAYGANNLSQMRYFSFAANADFASLSVEPQVLYETTPFSVRSGPADYRAATGLFNELSVTSEGLLVVFYDHTIENVAWIERIGEQWGLPEFRGVQSGPYVSGRKDANGVLHLAYMDTSIPALVYWRSDNGQVETIMDGVRDTGDAWVITDIGESVRLRLRSNGRPSVIFQDASRFILHGAERGEAGGWTVQTISGGGAQFNGSHGFFAAATSHPGGYLMAHFVIDNRAQPSVAYPIFHEVP